MGLTRYVFCFFNFVSVGLKIRSLTALQCPIGYAWRGHHVKQANTGSTCRLQRAPKRYPSELTDIEYRMAIDFPAVAGAGAARTIGRQGFARSAQCDPLSGAHRVRRRDQSLCHAFSGCGTKKGL